jgi:hypothetical protein
MLTISRSHFEASCLVHGEAKLLRIKLNLVRDVGVVLSALHDEATPIGTEELRRLCPWRT